MLLIELPVTVPLSELVAVADEVLNASEKFDVAVAPLLAAAAPIAEAVAAPLLWFLPVLLSLYWSEFVSVSVFVRVTLMFAVLVRVSDVLVVSVFVLLSVFVEFCVFVLELLLRFEASRLADELSFAAEAAPLSGADVVWVLLGTESLPVVCACALMLNASDTAAASKVLFMLCSPLGGG
jgi:hypothetical protein